MSEFPYDAVVDAFRRVGKHFVGRELLEALDRVRSTEPPGEVRAFLDVCLDKYDGRFDNPSYIALDLLPLASGERLIALLVADVLRFERERRPGARLTAKRCRLGERALASMAPAEPTAAEARMLRITMLPVSRVHDEYMFIRMLQCYEVTFALMATQLRDAIAHPERAAAAIDGATDALRRAAPLWSLVATVEPQAFLTFREYTSGASAIQSRNYKTVESLCRRPDPERLDSPAYHSVPEVRERVLAGQPTLVEVVDARAEPAMRRFEAALHKWRHSHYRLAMKLLGRRPGTGYTEGVPYLERARSIPLFAPAGA